MIMAISLLSNAKLGYQFGKSENGVA